MADARSITLMCIAFVATLACACRKTGTDALDGGRNADASTIDAASSLLVDAEAPAVTPTASASAAPSAPQVTSLAALQPAPLPFNGTFRCFGGMKLEQVGRIVTSTMRKGTTDTVLACTAGTETCTGTVREIQNAHGKPPKVTRIQPVTLQRTPAGDILYVLGGSEKKPSKSDQTLCQRR